MCGAYYIGIVVQTNSEKVAIEVDELGHDNYNTLKEKNERNT